MKVTKTSAMTGVTHTLDLDITQDQLDEYSNRRNGQGRLIQEIFPNLDENEREFLMTGITGEEWEEMFGE